jgi:hypothetical protein
MPPSSKWSLSFRVSPLYTFLSSSKSNIHLKRKLCYLCETVFTGIVSSWNRFSYYPELRFSSVLWHTASSLSSLIKMLKAILLYPCLSVFDFLTVLFCCSKGRQLEKCV